jgi:hypothetical protein
MFPEIFGTSERARDAFFAAFGSFLRSAFVVEKEAEDRKSNYLWELRSGGFLEREMHLI